MNDEKRRDKKRRVLLKGETQLPHGQYRYKYIDAFGRVKYVYSWKLVRTDPVPKGKRDCESLREKEERIQADIKDSIDADGKHVTVMQMLEKHYQLNVVSKKNTIATHNFIIESIRKDMISNMKITMVKQSDAIAFVVRMQKRYSYSTVSKLKCALKATFDLAINDDYIRKNPFTFELNKIIPNDAKKVEALTIEQTRMFVDFIQNDRTYKKLYDATIVLLETGLRISELCGLTKNDIDLEHRTINVDHQLMKDTTGYYVEKTKTACGRRMIPMSSKCCEAFERILKNSRSRKVKNKHMVVDGYKGFLFLKDNGEPMDRKMYSNHYSRIVKKYNKAHSCSEQLPNISPHVLRHTFCTRCVYAGINQKALQYIMGHEDISVTMNTYTSASYEDVFNASIDVLNSLKS
ncbi:MAG: site-specific integrase [Erysipelotrichaceae bacterium]|nr:site-specific integrase [Erysipelotrichaceae bacterium]